MFKFILPKFQFRIEKWKWNSDYRVYVSTLGNFKDEYKNLITVKIDNKGYCVIKTNCGFKKAHRLVMLTWKPIPDAENLTVDHINHNKRDNSVNNLEWVTKEENLNRAKNDLITAKKIEKIKEPQCWSITPSGKTKKYYNIDAAVHVLYNKQVANVTDINKTRKKIKKNIMKAINNNTRYCGKNWKLVYKEEK